MGTTYLNLTNAVLRRFNDVELASAGFSTTTTYHAYVKDVVNDIIREIQQTERQWPFNHATKEQTLVLNQLEYGWPTAAGGDTDAEAIDWESFFLVKDDSLSISQKKLELIGYDDWLENYKSTALNAITTGSDYRIPKQIYNTQNNKWGVQLPPDRLYKVSYEYWGYPSELSAHDDTTSIPSRFDWVIKHGCFAEVYGQRGNMDMRDRYSRSYRDGVKDMRELLIDRPGEFRDGRVAGAGQWLGGNEKPS